MSQYTDKETLALLEKSRSVNFSSILLNDPVIIGEYDLSHRKIITLVEHRISQRIDKKALSFYLFNKIYSCVCSPSHRFLYSFFTLG